MTPEQEGSINRHKNALAEIFGSEVPSVSERTVYFFNKWNEWEDNSAKLKTFSVVKSVNKLMYDLGYVIYKDFMVRNGEIRCADKELLAFAKLSGLNEMVE